MPCPHSTRYDVYPSQCSQCRKARVTHVDPGVRTLTFDRLRDEWSRQQKVYLDTPRTRAAANARKHHRTDDNDESSEELT